MSGKVRSVTHPEFAQLVLYVRDYAADFDGITSRDAQSKLEVHIKKQLALETVRNVAATAGVTLKTSRGGDMRKNKFDVRIGALCNTIEMLMDDVPVRDKLQILEQIHIARGRPDE